MLHQKVERAAGRKSKMLQQKWCKNAQKGKNAHVYTRGFPPAGINMINLGRVYGCFYHMNVGQ